MENIPTKVDGVDVLPADQWNQVPSEIENIILSAGITLSSGDLFQLGKAVANYAAHGDFYADSGSSTAYVLTGLGSKQVPTAYADGYRARFFAGNTNTSASTINISGLGVKSIVDKGGIALVGGEILVGQIQTIVFDNANDRFILEIATSNSGRNLLINANPLINQRVYVSAAATSGANEYTLDRWRVVTSGQALTFSTSLNVVTMTLPVGGIEQEIEGINIQSGTHVISFVATGDTVVAVDGTPRANGDTFTLTGGTNATIKASSAGGAGTIKLIQVEAGSVPTPFEHRNNQSELDKCLRYFQKTFPLATAPAQNAGLTGAYQTTVPVVNQSQSKFVALSFMRVAPSFTFYNPSAANANWAFGGVGATGLDASENGFILGHASAPTIVAGSTDAIHFIADAEL